MRRRQFGLEHLPIDEGLMFLSSPVKLTFPTDHFESMRDATDFYRDNCDVFMALERLDECGAGSPVDWGHEPGDRCWFWWLVDAPGPRQLINTQLAAPESTNEPPGDDAKWVQFYDHDGYDSSPGYLHRHKLLSDEEIDLLKSHNTSGAVYRTPFRRTWCWWQYHALEPRDVSVLESSQLTQLGVLTTEEHDIIRDPEKASIGQFGGSRVYYHLHLEERKLLGLDAIHKRNF